VSTQAVHRMGLVAEVAADSLMLGGASSTSRRTSHRPHTHSKVVGIRIGNSIRLVRMLQEVGRTAACIEEVAVLGAMALESSEVAEGLAVGEVSCAVALEAVAEAAATAQATLAAKS
jgi:hypothetical protein